MAEVLVCAVVLAMATAETAKAVGGAGATAVLETAAIVAADAKAESDFVVDMVDWMEKLRVVASCVDVVTDMLYGCANM
jgi:hypothetical protein